MLDQLTWLQRLFGFTARGVIHVGAHDGGEHEVYTRLGIRKQILVEPHPDTFRRLASRVRPSPDVTLMNVACGARAGKATMYVTAGNEGASNSLLELSNHLREFPEITPAGTVEVDVLPLDDALANAGLNPQDYNLLTLDVQGFELEVLRGATGLLDRHIDAVFSEIQRIQLYRGACLVSEVDRFMLDHGFQRILTHWIADSFGDGLYLRADAGKRLRRRVFGSLGTLAYQARFMQNRLRRRLTGGAGPASPQPAPTTPA